MIIIIEYKFGVVTLSKLITNNLLFDKSLKIKYNCLLGPLILTTKIARITFLAIFKPLVLLQTWQNILILTLIYIFLTT